MIGTSGGRGGPLLRPFHDDRDPLAAADAGRRHAALLSALLQLDQQGVDEPRPGRAQRMAEAIAPPFTFTFSRSRPSVLLDRQVLPRERLVDLEQVELVELRCRRA